ARGRVKAPARPRRNRAATEKLCKAFAESFAAAAIARDWARVRDMLAPWLAAELDTDAVRAFFEDDYRSTLAGWNITELVYPIESEVGGNSSTLIDLRTSDGFTRPRPIPEEVTEANFLRWATVRLM